MVDLNEEPWESEIGAMLGGLPDVEPPSGFFDAALDHRPLHAGRIMVAMLGLSVVALVLAVATGATGRSRIAPEVDELADRHDIAVEAGFLSVGDGNDEGDEADYRVETPVEMPDGFLRSGNIASEDIRQAIYSRGDESVSIFVQEGQVNWDSLPADGLTEFDGLRAWVDENRSFTVVETTNDVVAIVGLPTKDVEDVLAEVPRTGPSLSHRIQDLVGAVTEQLGYPDLD